MTTLHDLQHDLDWSLDAINVLVPSLADAVPMARRLLRAGANPRLPDGRLCLELAPKGGDVRAELGGGAASATKASA